MNDFFKSPKTKTLLYTLCGILVILVVFGMGILVGYRRAIFATRWSDDYYGNFYGPPFGGPPPLMGAALPGPFNTHGVVGEVIDVESSTMSVEGQNGNEEMIFVSSGTPIREMSNAIQLMGIKDGDHVVIIGEPDDSGQVEAKFVRVFEGSTTSQ